MDYYFETTIEGDMNRAEAMVRDALADEGFGVLTEIDVAATMQAKLGAELYPYRILGACHPESAYRAIQAESRIGTMLPCNVILREAEPGHVEVSAVDPLASMQAIPNPALSHVARDVQNRLRRVIETVSLETA